MGPALMGRARKFPRERGAGYLWPEGTTINAPTIRYRRRGFVFRGLDTTLYEGTPSNGAGPVTWREGGDRWPGRSLWPARITARTRPADSDGVGSCYPLSGDGPTLPGVARHVVRGPAVKPNKGSRPRRGVNLVHLACKWTLQIKVTVMCVIRNGLHVASTSRV